LPVRQTGANNLDYEWFKTASAEFESPLKERCEHRQLAARLPKVADAYLLGHAFEGDVPLPGRAARTGEKIVKDLG
jgi:hypothetical protein